MRNLVIIGAGGHGKVCAEIAMAMKKWKNIYFLDDCFPRVRKCLNFEIVGKTNDFNKFKEADFFVAIGNNKVRSEFLLTLEKLDINIITLIHPSSIISTYSKIGDGTSIHQNAIINTDSKIGRGCIINTNAIVEHENYIDNFVHLSPGVNLGGQVKIGEYTWLGIGSTVINNINIDHEVIIGANSLILSDIKSAGVYKGLVK